MRAADGYARSATAGYHQHRLGYGCDERLAAAYGMNLQ